MSANLLRTDELRIAIVRHGFSVKTLATQAGMDVRTLERRFRQQLGTTPKAWIKHERLIFAPPLLAGGLSNKEVAASLSYTSQSNFCRDFKQHFGRAPQEFTRAELDPVVSRFDKEMSRFDKRAELPLQST